MERYGIETHKSARADIDKIVDHHISKISSSSPQQHLDDAFKTLAALDRACTNIEKGFTYFFSPATPAEYVSAGINTKTNLYDTHQNLAHYHFYECLGFRFTLLISTARLSKKGVVYHVQEIATSNNSDITAALIASENLRNAPSNED